MRKPYQLTRLCLLQNATLEAENKHLRSDASGLERRVERADSENCRLQQSHATLQGQHSAQQLQLAKLQVSTTDGAGRNGSEVASNLILNFS